MKQNHSVYFEFYKDSHNFHAHFEVQKFDQLPWVTTHEKNAELWNFDVVEIFLQWRNGPEDVNAPYLECEFSPNEKQLNLIIIEPRKRLATPWMWQFTFENQLSDKEWKARLCVPTPRDLPFLKDHLKHHQLYGGAFACLGTGTGREYYSLNPNPEERPDFHRPELFIPF